MTQREEILQYVDKEYGTRPEHLFRTYTSYTVLRHQGAGDGKKNKWYGIIMDVNFETLGIHENGYVDILDVKCDKEKVEFLKMANGYFPAYHMNKASWITVLLDGTVPTESIFKLLDESFSLTAGGREKKKAKITGPKDYLVPANPKYYDLITAFKENDIIDWKQSNDVHVGDMIYMYVAAPYSQIMYKCEAVEVDIPYNYESKELTVKKVMKIKKLCQYEDGFMTFARMKDEYGIFAVRGPRGIPDSLKEELSIYEADIN